MEINLNINLWLFRIKDEYPLSIHAAALTYIMIPPAFLRGPAHLEPGMLDQDTCRAVRPRQRGLPRCGDASENVILGHAPAATGGHLNRQVKISRS
jgi:hypothetical protein